MESGVAVHAADDLPKAEALISPKQLNVRIVGRKLALALNEKWHSRMPLIGWIDSLHPIFFGAEFGGAIYAVAMWSMPIAANRLTRGFERLELRRMAISSRAPKYTASRMLSVMTKYIRKSRPEIIGLLSYQDTGAHSGTIYKASGWKSVEPKGSFVSWRIHSKNPGTRNQSEFPKIRWELDLRKTEIA